MENYQETVDWMFQRLPMYQKIGVSAFKKDLTNIQLFSSFLNNPHNSFRTIHVAGTNGKGSTSHMLASILQESGLKVGLYTSPHLKDFRERIKINGIEIPEIDVVNFISQNKDFLEQHDLSFFEMSVGMAFKYFKDQEVDIAVIEVGLGGRLDSTNIIRPILSIITNIGLDHTQMLGNTLGEIAREKAGIIKEYIPVIIGENNDNTKGIFKEIANNVNAEIVFAEDEVAYNYNSDLKGDYQKKNIQTVVTAVKNLINNGFNISEENLISGLLNVKSNTGLRGRWEILKLQPKVICDTAHNAEGLNYVLKQLQREVYKDLHIVLGMSNDKDLPKMLYNFPKNAKYYFCKPDVPRGMEAEILKEKSLEFGLLGDVYHSVSKAYNTALKNAKSNDLIFIGGSTFTVAEII